MPRIAACTIVAKNYMALARTLGASLERWHPEVDFTILVIDPPDAPFEFEQPRATVLGPQEVIPSATFEPLTATYDITELSTALKPHLLQHLLGRGFEQVYYFDPDIQVFAPLDEIFARLEGKNVVLTPHLLAPIPFDGLEPTELNILQSGAYNLGFIGVAASEETNTFLAWWRERLEIYCEIALERGLFVDQKWIDLVPGMVPGVAIVDDPGYNVAYWNLNARELTAENGVVAVNGRPLRFFHFSGFNTEYPSQLSKHQTRTPVVPGSILAGLLAGYVAALQAHDHDTYRHLPYTYGFFTHGVPFDHVCRAWLKLNPLLLKQFPRPFDAALGASYFAWLNTRVGDGLTRYALGLHRSRADLQAAFPEPRGAYGRWLALHAESSGVAPAFASAFGQAASSVADPARQGVNLAGYLTAELGIGEAALGAEATHAGHERPTFKQGIEFIRHALRVRPELILRPEWAASSSHGRIGRWGKRVVQMLTRLYISLTARQARSS